jgi:hypothetical protein
VRWLCGFLSDERHEFGLELTVLIKRCGFSALKCRQEIGYRPQSQNETREFDANSEFRLPIISTCVVSIGTSFFIETWCACLLSDVRYYR